ncbi:hypothetical protein JKP88DRAFT_203998 [Tribonema minus]|uniref:F-box domain-containing protein n=1 Tax=Tribonema minus TaxID=303371 RepID=A0A835YJW0_9STRA|nr:hypothetical protein JKP88DRAFT_203998 [Tribonema minus]
MAELPQEVLRSILAMLSLRDAGSLLLASKSTQTLLDDYCMPHRPSMRIRVSSGLLKTDRGKLSRASRPGSGVITGRDRVDGLSCYWEVELQHFTGLRLEIGVCSAAAVPDGGLGGSSGDSGCVDRAHTWTFDCAGRARHGAVTKAYGASLPAGAVVGVLFNARAATLTFFCDGVCMGVAHHQVRAAAAASARGRGGGGLYPIVIIPSVTGERVAVRAPRSRGALPGHIPSLLATRHAWRPPTPPIPGSPRCLIVETFSAAVNYRVPLPGCTVGGSGCGGGCSGCGGATVRDLKQLLAQDEHLKAFAIEPSCLQLSSGGALLCDDSKTLDEVGIRFGENGAQLQDVFLYV